MNAATVKALATFLAGARKAYAAGAAAAVFVYASLPGSLDPGLHIAAAVGAGVFAAVLVFFIPNQPAKPSAPVAPSTPPAA